MNNSVDREGRNKVSNLSVPPVNLARAEDPPRTALVSHVGSSSDRREQIGPDFTHSKPLRTARQPEKQLSVNHRVRILLSGLPIGNFDTISDQIIYYANKSECENDGSTLRQVVELVFKKAKAKLAFSEIYARLCRKMIKHVSPNVRGGTTRGSDGQPIAGGMLFHKYLVNRCRENFEHAKEDTLATAKTKRQGLCLVRFIAELFKLSVLNESNMHDCITELLSDPKEEKIERLYVLLTTVGRSLDNTKGRNHMDIYFERINEMAWDNNVNACTQLVLLASTSVWQSLSISADRVQDVIELRVRHWRVRPAILWPPPQKSEKRKHVSRLGVYGWDNYRDTAELDGWNRINQLRSISYGSIESPTNRDSSPKPPSTTAPSKPTSANDPKAVSHTPLATARTSSTSASALSTCISTPKKTKRLNVHALFQTPTTAPPTTTASMTARSNFGLANHSPLNQSPRSPEISRSSLDPKPSTSKNVGQRPSESLGIGGMVPPPPSQYLTQHLQHPQHPCLPQMHTPPMQPFPHTEPAQLHPASTPPGLVSVDEQKPNPLPPLTTQTVPAATQPGTPSPSYNLTEASFVVPGAAMRRPIWDSSQNDDMLLFESQVWSNPKVTIPAVVAHATRTSVAAWMETEAQKELRLAKEKERETSEAREKAERESTREKEETERKIRDEEGRKAQEVEDTRFKAEAEAKAKAEVEFKLEEKTERKAEKEAARKAKEDEEVRLKTEAEAKAKEATEAKAETDTGTTFAEANTGVKERDAPSPIASPKDTNNLLRPVVPNHPSSLSLANDFNSGSNASVTPNGTSDEPLDGWHEPREREMSHTSDTHGRDRQSVVPSGLGKVSTGSQATPTIYGAPPSETKDGTPSTANLAEPISSLEISGNRWVGGSVQRTQQKIQNLLNKLTMNNFDLISHRIIQYTDRSEQVNDGSMLMQVVKLVFASARNDAMYADMYARLCHKMTESLSPNIQDETAQDWDEQVMVGGMLFRKYLFGLCQAEFQRGWGVKGNGLATAARAKRLGLGLVRFMGELFKLRMLTERIVHECIKKLLPNVADPKEEDIESLCELLTTVGQSLDRSKARNHINTYFERMKEMADRSNLTWRI